MQDKKFIEQAFEHSYQEVCDLEQRIVALQYSIMDYLGFHGSYSCDLESEFRKELEFLEKN